MVRISIIPFSTTDGSWTFFFFFLVDLSLGDSIIAKLYQSGHFIMDSDKTKTKANHTGAIRLSLMTMGQGDSIEALWRGGETTPDRLNHRH